MARFRLHDDGFSLNLEVRGSGPPLVLLHGFTGSAAAWGNFGDRLAGEFRIIAVDIVGHGASDAPRSLDSYRMERVRDDIVRAVSLAGFEHGAWLGYSMGGRTALHIAVAHPEAVERLALVGASPGLAKAAEREARIASDQALAADIERDGIEAFVDRWESLPLFATQRRLPRDVREKIRAGRLACRPHGLANSLRGMGTGAQPPLHNRLASLPMPVLLLAGEED
ncbi:MAG: 2-succinyl-6-hydroxy-2,4-cyclohexadiene-1-carboxylate synthase, partial [Dehalococcoidia bacterium]